MMSRHVFHNDTLATSTSREKVRDGKTRTENEEEEFSRSSWVPHASLSQRRSASSQHNKTNELS